MALRPASEKAQDFANWICNFAEREDMAVLAVVWDRKFGTPAILVIEGAENSIRTDGMGGFNARLTHTLLSQDDIAEALIEAAIEKLHGRRTKVGAMPRDRERA